MSEYCVLFLSKDRDEKYRMQKIKKSGVRVKDDTSRIIFLIRKILAYFSVFCQVFRLYLASLLKSYFGKFLSPSA